MVVELAVIGNNAIEADGMYWADVEYPDESGALIKFGRLQDAWLCAITGGKWWPQWRGYWR